MEPEALEIPLDSATADAGISPLFAYAPIIPEIVLATGALALLMFGVFREDRSAEPTAWLSIALLGIAGLLLLTQEAENKTVVRRHGHRRSIRQTAQIAEPHRVSRSNFFCRSTIYATLAS